MTLEYWGWNDQWAARAAELGVKVSNVARVVGQDRGSWSLETRDGSATARIPSTTRLSPSPVVGDWVVAESGPTPTDPRSLVAVLPRQSKISRGSAGTGEAEQILAANVDTVWIVHGLDLDLNPRRLERYLAIVWDSGSLPEIVLTKSDLTDDLDAEVARARAIAMGVSIRTVSSEDPVTVEDLRDTLQPGCTICLLGPSGVGKSTLVNLLAGGEVARTGEVRAADRKGRHTTSRRELFRIPGGALLLDTPGMRELRIWVLEEGLTQAFPDIAELSEDCRFRDCRHETEPGCAVLAAVDTGVLHPDRLSSFRKLQAEAAYEARKTDPRARADALSDHKAALKSLKYHPKYKKTT